jgi:hypothetical protein
LRTGWGKDRDTRYLEGDPEATIDAFGAHVWSVALTGMASSMCAGCGKSRGRAFVAPMFFARLWPDWPRVCGPKSKPVAGRHRIFSLLMYAPHGVAALTPPKAMPVIPFPAEARISLTAEPAQAPNLRRSAPDDALLLLARE